MTTSITRWGAAATLTLVSVSCAQIFGLDKTYGETGGGQGGSSSTTTTVTSMTSASGGGTSGGGGPGGSTAATGGGGGSGGDTATTSGVGGGGPENCVNGVDDDGNGKVDCEDPACMTGFICVPSAPPAWNGPVVLYEGAPATLPAQCPPEHPQKAFEGNKSIVSEPASCSACSCAAPVVTCTLGALAFRNMAACTNGLGLAAQPGDGMCGPINPPAPTESYAVVKATANAAACTPMGGLPTIPPPKWQTSALACTGGGQGTGCGAESACIPKSAPPFDLALCVFRDGDKVCPATFPQKHVFVENVIDNRDCSACTCGNVSATCSAITKIYASADCSGAAIVDVPNDASCVPGGIGASIKPTVTKSASCAPSGGQPIGSIQEGNQLSTVCCTP